MPQSNLDPIEREALAYIVRELEAGRTHVLIDTFRPFLESLDAGQRLVAILRYFEGLEILTPENPPGNRSKVHPLAGLVIPAYWRIEGKAVSLHRQLQEPPSIVQRPDEVQEYVEWSTADSVSRWARVFGVSRNTMSKMLKDKKIRNKPLTSTRYMIDLADTPAEYREKHRRARTQ